MNSCMFRLALAALATALMALGASQALAQSPPASPAPSTPPPAAQAPAGGATVQAADPFGAEVDLGAKKVVIAKGSANWDAAFDTLIDSLKALDALLEKQGIKPS